MTKNMENLKKQIQTVVNIYKSGDLSKAELLTKELIKTNPNVEFLYNLLGLIFAGQEKTQQAIEYYEKAITINPNFAMAYNNLGLLHANKSDYKNAENYYKKSISLDSNIAEPVNNLGSLYNSLSKFEKAIECYKKAILINSKFAPPHHNIGNVYLALGNFVEAKKHFEESVKLNPKYLESHRSLSRLSKYKTNNDEHFIQLREIYKKTSNNDLENKSSIAFALAKAYEDISDYDKSFTFYKEANTLYRKKVTFSIIQEEENFKETKDTFSKKLYEKYLNTGNLKNSPIFIIGMPRSGTTLIEQILSNHPKVFGADEIEFIPDLVKKNFRDNKLTLYFNNIINFDQKILKEIGDEYISKINNISENSERSTDKLTTNFLFIGLIKLILPKSKIVHCYRNSRDNCLSIFKNHFPSGKINYAYSLDEIVKYYNLYYDLMDYWRKLLPNFIFDIKYENLISNTKNEINDLLEFCNLNWSDSCLNFYENKRPIKTASHIQARSKIYKTSVDSWKKYEKNLSDHFKKLIN